MRGAIQLPPASQWTIIGDPIYDARMRRTSILCRCSCGTEKIVLTGNLTRGKSISCGCVRNKLAGDRVRSHGLHGTPEYRIWRGIKNRCLNTSEDAYERYGGRGITVCERWLNSFPNFLADVGARPSPEHSIDRWPDKNGNYEPENVRWATAKEQANNTRRNRLLTYQGETLSVAMWADRLGIPSYTIYQRISNLGWSTERALTTNKPKRETL